MYKKVSCCRNEKTQLNYNMHYSKENTGNKGEILLLANATAVNSVAQFSRSIQSWVTKLK